MNNGKVVDAETTGAHGAASVQYRGDPANVGLTKREGFGTSELERHAETSMAAAAEQARAMIEARTIVALRRPRDMDDVRQKLLKECHRPSFATVARYRKPVGGGTVEGPSVRFVEGALRCMGNIAQDTTTVFDDEHKRIVRVSVSDLEANLTFSTDVTIEKTVERKDPGGREVISSRTNSSGETTYLVVAIDDELLNKTNALVSKALRNNGLRVVPGDIVDEGQTIASATRRSADATDPDAARKRISDNFGDMGIKPSELKSYLGHELEQMVPAELEELRGVYAAIKDGETSWRSVLDAKLAERSAPKAEAGGAPAAGGAAPTATAAPSVGERMRQKAAETRAAGAAKKGAAPAQGAPVAHDPQTGEVKSAAAAAAPAAREPGQEG